MSEQTKKMLSKSGKIGAVLLQKKGCDTLFHSYDSWPQSLCSVLEVLLVSKSPMQLFWGPQSIWFFNDAYLSFLQNDQQALSLLGAPAHELEKNLGSEKFKMMQQVFANGTPLLLVNESFALFSAGDFNTSKWDIVFSPVFNETGEIGGVWISYKASDGSDQFEKKHENQMQFQNMIMKSPFPMTVLRGKDHIIEFANIAMLEHIWKKKSSEVIGKKLLDVFPEVNDQKYPALLKKVLDSGIAHKESESLSYLNNANTAQKFYLDFEYLPLSENDGTVSGIMITVNDVTQKVEAKKIITDGEERLRLATEAAELATWELDLKEKTVIHSPRLAEIFGYSKSKQLKHQEMRDHIHPDDIHNIVEAAFENALSSGIYQYESRIVKSNSEVSWIRTHGKVFYDENNAPIKIIGTLRDITEEKQFREDLLESEQKFRLLANSMPQFVWTSDFRGNLNYFNDTVFAYSGLTQQELENRGWLQIVHPDDQNETVARWMSCVKLGTEFHFEHRFQKKDGEYRWQLSRALPQKDANGNIQMWIGTSTDIQDQKLFTQELEEKVVERTKELQDLNKKITKSEERFQLMISEIEDHAIIYLNADGIIENWNRGAEKMKGYSADEIVGKSFSVFYSQDDIKEKLPNKFLHSAATSGHAEQERWCVRKDGSRFWANILISSIKDENNRIIGFSKVIHDLTEKKVANEKILLNTSVLEQKNIELEKMNAELQSFAYISSHDLQEPLRKIQIFANRLLDMEYANLSENAKYYFSRMQEAANRMQVLINDLLSYSKTNIAEKEFLDTSLGDIVREVQLEYQDLLEEKNGTIDVCVIGKAKVIPFQFRQLIDNLIGNAIKFSKPDRPPHIVIKSNIGKGAELGNALLDKNIVYCHLQISDNGIGFESQYSDRIFEVFQRLHEKEEFSGTGIGLAIVKKIVENHNGIISASGELHQGATFDIYLPYE